MKRNISKRWKKRFIHLTILIVGIGMCISVCFWGWGTTVLEAIRWAIFIFTCFFLGSMVAATFLFIHSILFKKKKLKAEEQAKQTLSLLLARLLVKDNPSILVAGNRLILVYNGRYPGLRSMFDNDDEIEQYIENSLEDAYHDAIEYVNKHVYLLNIASTNRIEYSSSFVKMLRIFTPIIQRFIIDNKSGDFDSSSFKKNDLFAI